MCLQYMWGGACIFMHCCNWANIYLGMFFKLSNSRFSHILLLILEGKWEDILFQGSVRWILYHYNNVFFPTWDSQVRITRSGELLIKRWERFGIPWEANNGGSGVFLWYPEQQALENQVQLNSNTHTHAIFDKHLAKEVPFLIKGCTLVWCVFLLMTCFFNSVVSVYGHVNFPLCELACVCCVCMSPVWWAAVSFRCSSSSCSLISAGPLPLPEGNPVPGSACLGLCCWSRCGLSANRTSIHLRKRKTCINIHSHSQIQSL